MQDLRASLPDYPITGICVVRDINHCPNGYKPIDKTHDRQDDADLWKDSMFGKRNTRYICVTRIYPLAQGALNNVLVDVVINNEKDSVPAGFSHVDLTQDTREKAVKKKNFCVKMISRNTTTSAITDLILLSKAKRAPPGYTIVGDINNILLCYKMGPVPPETQNKPLHSPLPYVLNPTMQQTQPTFGTGSGYHASQPPAPPIQPPHMTYQQMSPPPNSNYTQTNDLRQGQGDARSSGSSVQSQPPTLAVHPLKGIPFKLHSAFDIKSGSDHFVVPELSTKSRSQIHQEFLYPFTIEKTAAQRIPPELD